MPNTAGRRIRQEDDDQERHEEDAPDVIVFGRFTGPCLSTRNQRLLV
jgi:hypothetical protein